jgi:hypothetical protein
LVRLEPKACKEYKEQAAKKVRKDCPVRLVHQECVSMTIQPVCKDRQVQLEPLVLPENEVHKDCKVLLDQVEHKASVDLRVLKETA